MTPTEFDDLLHDCLDQRRDPLDAPQVCEYLALHPHALERFAALRQQLAALPATVPATLPASLPAAAAGRPHRRSPWVVLAAAAAVAALALLRADPAPPPEPPGRVLTASLQELHPRAHAAVSFTVRQVLAATPSTRFESFEIVSQRR